MNGSVHNSLENFAGSMEAGEVRNDSAEATSLFTGSPSHASQMEGDHLAESSALTDAPESASLSAFPSESVSVPVYCFLSVFLLTQIMF